MRNDWSLLSTDLYIIGEWRNGGIARKSIAHGIGVTILVNRLQNVRTRKRTSIHGSSGGSFGLVCLLHIIHLGCSPADECDHPSVACEDNVAVTCASRSVNELQSYLELRRDPCTDRFCRVSNGIAFCALDSADDPDCPVDLRENNKASGCVGNVLTTWRYGARISTKASADGMTCLALDDECNGEAYCVTATNPEPLCTSAFNRCVDEHIIAYCRCGFQIDAHACQNPGPRCMIENSVAVCRP